MRKFKNAALFSIVLPIFILQIQVKIEKGKLDWDQFFKEPYEKIIFIFKDQTFISFHTYEEHRINLSASYMVEQIEKDGRTIKDVATIIHNHPVPSPFSMGDNYIFYQLKIRGFDGFFMIYYPFNDSTRIKEHEKK